MTPPKLQKNDLIGIIAPCSVVNEGQSAPAIAGLEALGYRVVLGKNLSKRSYGYSASEQERADDFNAMVANDDVRMVLFGGGYGGNEILPLIDFETTQKHPKIIASYSDGTNILNAVTCRTGLETYYGQRPATFVQLTPDNQRSFETNLVHDHCPGFVPGGPWEVLCPGTARGTLVGGYLENFSFLVGNPYFSFSPDQDYLLFLEDYEDFTSVAKVSMHLSNLEQSPLFSRVVGLLWGHYSATRDEALMDRLRRLGTQHRIPVIACDDFGHGSRHGILPLGRAAVLDGERRGLFYG